MLALTCWWSWLCLKVSSSYLWTLIDLQVETPQSFMLQ
jgi:hypothetical protein